MGLLRRLRRILAGIVRRFPFSSEIKGLLRRVVKHLSTLNPIQLHDVINLVAIGAINVLNLIHLSLGKGFKTLTSACMSYFIADIGYIAAFPESAKNAAVIIIHHIVSALYLMVPILLPRFRKLMSMCLLVEINTWLQIARKVFPHMFLELSFYASWLCIRLLYFPFLIPQFISLYMDSTDSEGSRHPLLLMACTFQTMLTSLNYFWTFELLVKVANRRKRNAMTAKAKYQQTQAASDEPPTLTAFPSDGAVADDVPSEKLAAVQKIVADVPIEQVQHKRTPVPANSKLRSQEAVVNVSAEAPRA